MRPRRTSRPVRLACLAATLGLLASCSAEEAGSLELVFHWPDGAPDWSEQRFSVWGRMERWPGGEQTGATIVGEATGPEGAAYALLGPEGAEALSFSRVAHETTLGVVIAVRRLADGATPSAGDDLIYYGASEPFRLEPDAHVTVTVPLGLQPAPGAAAVSPEGETGAGGGAVWICPPDTVTHDPATVCAITHINTGEVTVYVQAPHASQATLANDLSLSKGRRVLEIRDTTAFEEVGEDLFRLIAPWDLNEGLGLGDGSRSVYLQLQNEFGLASNIIERSVSFDQTPPDVNGTAFRFTSPPDLPPRQVHVLTRGTLFEITATTSEVLPILTAFGEHGPPAGALLVNQDGLQDGFVFETDPKTEISFGATYTVPVDGEVGQDGCYDLFVDLVDRAGNTAQASLGIVELDTEPPMAPPVDTPGAITYHRMPWGTDTTEKNASTVTVSAAVRPHNHRLLVYGGPNWCTSQLLGAVEPSDAEIAWEAAWKLDEEGRPVCYTDTASDPDPTPEPPSTEAAELELAPGDRAAVYVVFQDPAGNLSLGSAAPSCDTPAVRVRDVRWTATMGGKVAGSTAVNPHRLEWTSEWSKALVQLTPTEVGALGDSPDDGGLVTGVDRRWHARDHAPPPEAYQWHAMAYDASRGVTVLFGGSLMGGWVTQDTWEWDGESWTQRQTEGPVPAPRTRHAMAYDASRGVTVLFGGNGGSLGGGFFQDTWEWDGERWTERQPEGAIPPARNGHAMAYDASRGVTVLYGGNDSCAFFQCDQSDRGLQDIWEWDGEAWTERQPEGPEPPRRYGHAMAYHVDRGTMVVFGGTDSGVSLADTWEWDGQSWNERLPQGPIPEARSVHVMVYDAARAVTVLFGGYMGHADTWEWDGETWTERVIWPLPSSCFGHAMAYDTVRGVSVRFGGFGSCGADTYEWNGVGWSLRPPQGPSPPPTKWFAMAHDTARGATVLFGGKTGFGNIFLQDTWEWNGETWTEREPVGPLPPARWLHAMAYDSARGVTVLFGGTQSVEPDVPALQDTWEWDGETWTERLPEGPLPPPRDLHAMAYDSARGVTVLFGAAGYTQDTWEWDGETWTERLPVGPLPTSRIEHAMAYDAARGEVVLFGGSIGNNIDLADTWAWDGETWTEQHPAEPLPPFRFLHAMAHDTTRERTVLFGGGQFFQDTWEWDGEAWTEQHPQGALPPARNGHALAHDPGRGVTVLFGGDDSAGNELADTWEWGGVRALRAGHHLTVSWPAAFVSDEAELTSTAVTWRAGGLGHEAGGACSPLHGATLKAWTGFGWTPLAITDAGPDAPEDLFWFTTDPELLQSLFFGLPGEETLNFAVTPTAPNGCGPEYGRVATDYVEVTVGYRLPAELPPE